MENLNLDSAFSNQPIQTLSSEQFWCLSPILSIFYNIFFGAYHFFLENWNKCLQYFFQLRGRSEFCERQVKLGDFTTR